jgi:hypothetical protein
MNTIQLARSRQLGRTGPKLPEERYLSRSRPQQRKHGLHQIHRDGPTPKRTLSFSNKQPPLFIESSFPAPEAEDFSHWIVHLLGLARDPCSCFSTLPLPSVTSPFHPPFIFSTQVSSPSSCIHTHTLASLSGPLRTGSRSGWPVHSPGTPRPALPPTASAHRSSLHGPGPARGLTRMLHAPQRTPPARPGPRPVHDVHHVPPYTSDRRPGPGRPPDPTRTRHIPFSRNGPCSGTRWSSRLHVGKGGDSSALAREGNCGRAAAAPSRCRIVPVIWPRSGGGAPTSRTASPSPTWHITNSLATPSSYAGALDAESPAQVGRVYPKPPRCSPAGDENGVRLP